MSAETVAYSTLSAAAPVTAIVGTRIYPDATPIEQPLPAVAISRVATEYTTTIHSGVPIGVDATLEVWSMAETRKVAEQLADAVVTALGTAGFLMQDRSPEFDSDTKLFAAVLTVSYHET